MPIKIIDNCACHISEALEDYKNCNLILNSSNQGFGRACNQGALESKTEFLFFVNPDTILKNDAICELEKFADKNPKMGAANPLMENIKGKARLKMSSIVPCKKLPRPKLSEFGEMLVLSGGAMFVRREAFEKAGGFDPNIFLSEDHELCRISHQDTLFGTSLLQKLYI